MDNIHSKEIYCMGKNKMYLHIVHFKKVSLFSFSKIAL